MGKNMIKTLVAFTGAVAIAGCLGSSPSGGGSGPSSPTNPAPGGASNTFTGGNGLSGGQSTTTGGTTGTTTPSSDPTPSNDPQPAAPDPMAALNARTIDYGQSLRTAALKLVGSLPTIDEQLAVKDATTYAAQIDKYLADPRFAGQMLQYWQNVFKMGGPAVTTQGSAHPSFDTAPTFAAEQVVNDLPITNLFTATTNTCPTLNTTTGAFTDAACAVANGLTTVGILTDPGVQSQFYSNMSFRRVRWLQETFVGARFPAEYSSTPVAMGNGQYVSPWTFTSITGGTDPTVAPINFQDTSSVVCANCHTTMNHIAPLFANFDAQGVFQTTIQVKTPIPNLPTTKMTDWLPATETTHWRVNTPAATIADLGAAMAVDPAVASCFVARAWNWAMDKDDIVDDAAVVPASTIDTVVQGFVSGGYKMKGTLKAIFTSSDYVLF
jgi:Protein of unknown function (DUF1588)